MGSHPDEVDKRKLFVLHCTSRARCSNPAAFDQISGVIPLKLDERSPVPNTFTQERQGAARIARQPAANLQTSRFGRSEPWEF